MQLITTNPIRILFSRFLDLPDLHHIAALIVDLHFHLVTHMVSFDRFSERRLDADPVFPGIAPDARYQTVYFFLIVILRKGRL